MQNPKKRVYYVINPEHEKEIRIMVYSYEYKNDPVDSVAYDLLYCNPSLPLKSIRWRLIKDHGINKRISTLKKMAENCGLPYTE